MCAFHIKLLRIVSSRQLWALFVFLKGSGMNVSRSRLVIDIAFLISCLINLLHYQILYLKIQNIWRAKKRF